MVERATQGATPLDRNGAAARIVNVVAGAWLFLSAFLWQHSMAQRTNHWVLGLVIAAVALTSMRMPQARFVNSAVAVWLFISAFALPSLAAASVWNAVIVAVVVFVASMIGQTGTGPMRQARA